MAKRGERNIYGLLSTLTGIGEQYYRNKYAQDLAQQQVQAKFDEEQRKRQTEREDWLWKLGVQQDIKSQEEAQKDYLKQQQSAFDQQIANMLIAGKAPLERPIPADESQRMPSVTQGLPPEMAGIESRIEQEQLSQIPYGASSQIMTEAPIPFEESYKYLTQIEDAGKRAIAKQALDERYKPKVQTQIVPANRVPGFEKAGKDYVVPVKVTQDPATGEVKYEPTSQPYRVPTRSPSKSEVFEPASKYIKDAPEGMMIKTTTEVNEYGDVKVDKSQPFTMTTTDENGRNILTGEGKDYVKVAKKMNIPMRTYLKGVSNQTGSIAMFDENLKPILRSKDEKDIFAESTMDTRINSWNPDQVRDYWENRKRTIVENLKTSISPQAIWVYKDAWEETKKAGVSDPKLKRETVLDKSIEKLYKYMQENPKELAQIDMLGTLIQTDFLLSPDELKTLLQKEGLLNE